ncbi:FkbM family methyltransferase [Neoroseomonas rubea]|uniref:FkbM family methyltransferase n=1 Tax=Neoroseomonas rubea TaxID=2748666 RepID=UPI0018E04B3E|nr:FkbM family methyltransferase [Roseomonas rubea]
MTDEASPTRIPMDEAELFERRMARTGGDRSRLEWSGYKVYSQSDEDGIIDEIFRRIGAPNRTFVEFGCEVGLENNTRYLLEQGWRGLWMEGYPEYAGAIRASFFADLESGRLALRPTYVNRRNINDLIRDAGLSGEIDFLSIDIDGNDYHVFEAIDVISPRLVCLEHNHSFRKGEEWVMPYDEDYRWDPAAGRADYGASLASMAALAARKGYTLVGCGLVSPNGFYVRSDLVGDHFAGPFTAERFFNPIDVDAVLRYPVTPHHGMPKPRPPLPVAEPPPTPPPSPDSLRAKVANALPGPLRSALRGAKRLLTGG